MNAESRRRTRIQVALICVCLLTAFLCVPAQAQLPPELLLLSRIRQKAAANLSNIPNYVCLETIERTKRTAKSRRFAPIDTVRLEVAEVADREIFAWPGARLEETDLGNMIGFGSIGTGAFAGFARNTFLSDAPTFQYVGAEKLESRPALRYDFQISLFMSGYTVSNGKRRARVAESGSFWVDPKSLELLRITARAEEIPPELEMTGAVNVIDYAKARIGDSDFLLPAWAELTLTYVSGEQSRNVTRFQNCHKYTSESAVSFELPAEQQPTPRRAPAEVQLPAGLALAIRLTSEIDSRKAIVGDPLEAIVEEAVLQDGKERVPKGAIVRGRLRRMERVPGLNDCFALGLQFSEIEFGNTRAHFAAELEGMGRLPGASQEPVCVVHNPQTSSFPGRAASRSPNPVVLTVPTLKLPGVAQLFVSASHVVVPRGFRMVWRTVERLN